MKNKSFRRLCDIPATFILCNQCYSVWVSLFHGKKAENFLKM